MDTPLNITPISGWFNGLSQPLIIAGPCSAESEEQVMAAATKLARIERVKVFRAGIWKPRTRPGSFEGAGEKGLRWLQRVQRETGLLVTTEVATTTHIQMALDYGIDIVWIGARTTASPFTTEQLAAALGHSNIPVLVKNPITPDLELWIGALERFNRMGITKLVAVHRGFYPYEHSRLRNIPKWELAIDLKSRFPNLPVLCDPSHIAGRADMVEQVAQQGLNLSLDGLMVEVHPNPSTALSDARQQVSPEIFSQILQRLIFRDSSSACSEYVSFIEQTRNKIDSIDQQIIELLANRMRLVELIGEYKRDNNVTAFQLRRWERILESRVEYGERLGLSEEYIKNLLRLVHKESIRRQAEILGSKPQPNDDEGTSS